MEYKSNGMNRVAYLQEKYFIISAFFALLTTIPVQFLPYDITLTSSSVFFVCNNLPTHISCIPVFCITTHVYNLAGT